MNFGKKKYIFIQKMYPLFFFCFLLPCIQTGSDDYYIDYSNFSWAHYFQSSSTDSRSVIRDKFFIWCPSIVVVMDVCHSHVEGDAAVAIANGQCTFFIWCVMVAIKIKQLVLYFMSCLLLYSLLSIAWANAPTLLHIPTLTSCVNSQFISKWYVRKRRGREKIQFTFVLCQFYDNGHSSNS